MLDLLIAQAATNPAMFPIALSPGEWGIYGFVLTSATLIVRYLVRRVDTLQTRSIDREKEFQQAVTQLRESFDQKESSWRQQLQEIVSANDRLMYEILLYLKFVHKERTEEYEQFLQMSAKSQSNGGK